jgi:hypothetical protein
MTGAPLRAPAVVRSPEGSPIPRHLRIAAVCLLAGLPLFWGASPAAAAPSQQMIFDAQRDLLDPGLRPGALEELESLGVRSIRVILYWKNVAPGAESRDRPDVDLNDPAAYDWGEYDNVIAAARERNWRVLVTVSTPGPKWAMGGRRDFVTRPSPALFGRFVTAVGRRYGSQVDQWAVINEPNHPKFLLPQYTRGRGATSPRLYRQLFQAADRALRATGNGRDTLLMGETAPRGTGRVVAPLTFMRGVLCLRNDYTRDRRRSCGRLNADGYAHHAYTTRTGPFFVPPGRNDVTIGVLSRLTRALDRAGRAGMIRRNMPVFLTEFGIQSTPDRWLGVSLAQQAEFRSISERIAYGNSRVRAFSQYLLRDDDPIAGKSGAARYGGFESGLRFARGGAKPSLQGFRLPAAALRQGGAVSLWGMVRPHRGRTSVEILYQDRGQRTFRRLKTVRTNRYGAFTTRTRLREGRRYRLRWNDFQGAPVRVYRRR